MVLLIKLLNPHQMSVFYRYLTVLLFALISSTAIKAQNIDQLMADPSANFYTIKQRYQREMDRQHREIARERREKTATNQNAGNKTTAIEENEEEEAGYLHYQRWAWYMEPRVYPSGNLALPSTNWQEFETYLNTNPEARTQWLRSQATNPAARSSVSNSSLMSSNWSFAGPTGGPIGAGAGRINFLRFDPTNSNTLYAGAPAGGLWKSTNGGATWTTGTDFLTVIGCSDIAIDPTNTNIMYLATGDGNAGDTYSVGVLKSTDGGITWATTGLSWTVGQGRTITRLLMHPSNAQIILAATSNGIYRTTNGGTSWTQVQNASGFRDIEFKPSDPNTVYASSTRFYKSTDNGVTWTQITTGLPASNTVDRLSIAVTAANNTYVYILAGNNNNGGYNGVYRSTDAGVTFSQRSNSPNIMGWSAIGSGTDGQSWYDHGLVVSPTNQDEVYVGGINIWKSTNGGTSWTLNADWTGGSASYVHADIHDLVFLPGSNTTIFAGCDGGVFKTTNNGTNWVDISNNMSIAQIYRIGLSSSISSVWLTGHQDNGTNLKFGGSYVGVMGGDGMDCFIDRTTNNTMYGEQFEGSLNRSTDGGVTWTSIVSGLSGNAPWVTPWYQDPVVANTLYVGYTNLFKSTNQGTNWTQLTALPSNPGGTIVDFCVAPSNTQIIYVARASGIFKSTNGGTSWTSVTGTLPVANASISRIIVDPANANNILVSFSGYSTNNKVYRSTNGGTSWSNLSTGLPNIPANCIALVPGSTTGAAYVGMDVGVYYIDNTFTSWQPYLAGLANVPITDLEIYAPTKKIRAATYGRGVWEVDIYNDGTLAPIALIANSNPIICPGGSISFTDQSSFLPTSWSWSFPGATPSSSTAQNPPAIFWNTPGTYTVSLTATNANGSSTSSVVIAVLPAQNLPIAEGFENTTFLPVNWVPKNINNDIVYWDRSNVGRNSSWSARFNNYSLDAKGAQDEMWVPKTSFVGLQNCTLRFDVAHARYSSAYIDSLEVLISTDCGSTWTSVYMKGGTVLATTPDNTSSFTPTNSQWRNESINLNTYVGQANVIIAFRNRGHYGNNIYIDNVNISGQQASLPVAAFTPSANTICQGSSINFTDNSSNSPTGWSWSFPGATPSSSTTQNPSNITWNTAGTYTVSLTVSNGNGSNTTTRVITVNAPPVVTATAVNPTLCAGNSTTLNGGGANTYSWMPGSLTGAAVSISPQATTTYTVTGTATTGCTSTRTVTVTVNSNPNISASAANATICLGNSTSLMANGAATYNWMPGNLAGDSISVTPAVTTTYTVTGTAANNCTNTNTITITVNTPPAVPSITNSGNILSSTVSGSSYQWYLNGTPIPGAIAQSYTATQPGAYTVEVFTGNCSSGQSQATVITDLEDISWVNAFTVSPNPNEGEFTITFETSITDDYTLEVYNAVGQLVFTKAFPQFNGAYRQPFSVTGFATGIYTIRLRSNQNQSIIRALVK